MALSLQAVRFLCGTASAETDAELLGRYIDRRDQTAFAVLVRRHAPMVFGVCRRILPTDQDAEDAFQATFLILAEKAHTAAPREVGNWLHGVARRAALLLRRSIVRRRERLGDVPEPPASRSDELRAVLDEELSRLPEVYRTVVVLCDLEGRTRREAALMLGWPEGTVAGRLVRARELLAKRLAPVVSVATLLAGTASARVPEVLPREAIPAGVAALGREVMGVMARGKLMKAAIVLLLCCAGFGMVLQAGQEKSVPAKETVPPGSTDAPVQQPKSDEVVWGKEVDGLQAGLAATARTCRLGEQVKLTMKLRNVGKADVKIRYVLLREHAPAVTDAKGARITVAMPPSPRYYVPPTERVIKPGETITLYNPEVAVEAQKLEPLPGPVWPVSTPTIRVAAGKYKITFSGMIQSHPKLATGTVEFEVKPAKESTTAWGKEVDGVQVGIQLGQDRAYKVGETVTLVVRLRNNGKKEVPFNYDEEYFQKNPPLITDADGRAVKIKERNIFGIIKKASVAPGKEVDLCKLTLDLRPGAHRKNELRPKNWTSKSRRLRYSGPGRVTAANSLDLSLWCQTDEKRATSCCPIGVGP